MRNIALKPFPTERIKSETVYDFSRCQNAMYNTIKCPPH